MDIIERDVLLIGKEGGHQTMDFPITRLGNIEDTADVKKSLVPDDFIPVMDSADDGQMKKIPCSAATAQFAEAGHTHEEISSAIDTHNSSSDAHGDIREELAGKQDRLTGTQGQLVGFDKNGNAVPQAAPDTGVTTFNGRTGAITPQSGDYTAEQVGARPATWTPTAADIGAVPTTRKINNKALSADVSLTASDVGASPTGHKHTKSEVTDFPTSMPASDVPAWAKEASKPSYTASEVGARPSTWTPSAADVGALPTTGGTLTGNLTGKYITGTWLQTTSAGHLNSAATKIPVLDSAGWLYYRTVQELFEDMGAQEKIAGVQVVYDAETKTLTVKEGN